MAQITRVRRSKEERARFVSLFRTSGLSIDRFAARHQLSAVTLRSWVKGSLSPDFAPVRVIPSSPPSTTPSQMNACVVETSDGKRILFPFTADPRWVASLVNALS